MRRVSRLRKAATIGENRGMKVLCVDDHPTVREGVAFLIAQEFPDLALVHAGSLAEAEQSMLADPDIRLVLLDLGLPDADGLKAVNQLRTKCPDATIVVLSAETMPDIIVAAIDCGASGFIPKTANAKEMLAALRRVLDGDIYLPPAVLNARAQHPIPREVLGAGSNQFQAELGTVRWRAYRRPGGSIVIVETQTGGSGANAEPAAVHLYAQR
jgi:DNA-binding NarL/FixJ family response regulator